MPYGTEPVPWQPHAQPQRSPAGSTAMLQHEQLEGLNITGLCSSLGENGSLGCHLLRDVNDDGPT